MLPTPPERPYAAGYAHPVKTRVTHSVRLVMDADGRKDADIVREALVMWAKNQKTPQ